MHDQLLSPYALRPGERKYPAARMGKRRHQMRAALEIAKIQHFIQDVHIAKRPFQQTRSHSASIDLQRSCIRRGSSRDCGRLTGAALCFGSLGQQVVNCLVGIGATGNSGNFPISRRPCCSRGMRQIPSMAPVDGQVCLRGYVESRCLAPREPISSCTLRRHRHPPLCRVLLANAEGASSRQQRIHRLQAELSQAAPPPEA
jgi:hypothetical protein